MNKDFSDWANPTLERLGKYLDPEPTVETPHGLADAVAQGMARVRFDERTRQWAGLLGKQVLYRHPSGVSFWVRLGDGISMFAIREDSDNTTTKFVLSRLTRGGTFMDVGANTGWFALRAAIRYRELGGGLVHAFEPQPTMFDLITRSIEENGFEDLVKLHGIALGKEEQTIWMTTPDYNSGGAVVRFQRANKSAAIDMKRLDDLAIDVDKIDVMKVDIEGSEPLFIEGAKAFLGRYRPLILSELNSKKLDWVCKSSGEDYLDQVEALGYRTTTLRTDGTTVPFDRDEYRKRPRLVDVVFEPARPRSFLSGSVGDREAGLPSE